MIVYYITSHGFGHAVRSCEVIRRIPPAIPLTLRTSVPEWFLRHELGEREFNIVPGSFDIGTLGPDSSRIDFNRTLEVMEAKFTGNAGRLDDEARWLKSIGARVVVADVVPFAFEAASRARVFSILVANFTWVEIYRHLAEMPENAALAPRAESVIAELERQYAQGGQLLIPEFDVPMTACRIQIRTPLIARQGRNFRKNLAGGLGFDPARPVFLVYLGREGMNGFDLENAGRLEGLQLCCFGSAPNSGLDGLIRPIPEDLIDHADAAASVDGVLAKPGYGVCGECMASGTPLAHLTRPEFAETAAIEEALARWGGGVKMAPEDFTSFNWRPAFEKLAGRRRLMRPIDVTGGEVCARAIENAWRSCGC